MAQIVDFTAFSIDLYGRSKVESSCLRLQDEYGLDVNAVLFCYWYGAHHGVIGEELWQRIDMISGQWQGRVVRPLRGARRWLKGADSAPEEGRQRLRQAIKEDELAAELLQQRLMQNACVEADDGTGLSTQATQAAQRNAEALLRRRGIESSDEIRDLFAAISTAAFG